ncbi:hypothetical protein K435DRAFT_608969, partial [Dendrothele bispora CBS 962.96]
PPLPTPVTRHPNVLVDPRGVLNDSSLSPHPLLTLCTECYCFLTRGKVPPLSLANHMFLGVVPPELRDLTVVEKAMIARCHAKCWIIQMKEEE